MTREYWEARTSAKRWQFIADSEAYLARYHLALGNTYAANVYQLTAASASEAAMRNILKMMESTNV